MLRRTLKLAWFKRNRYALTIVAIGLSVAFIVSTLLLTASIADVGQPLNAAYGKVDVVVTGQNISEGDGPVAASNAPVPQAALDAITDAGFEAVGFSLPYAQVIDANGAAGGQAQSDANVAEPWLGDSGLNGFAIIEGAAPLSSGQIALDQSTANEAGLTVGDTVTFVTDSGPQTAELIGIALFGGADNDPYISTILLDETNAVFDTTTGYEYVLIRGDADADAVAETVTGLSPVDGLVVETGPAWIESEINALNDFLGFFQTFLTVFAVVAVVVGMLIVANTFTVSIAQRTQELALLRLVGTTRRQLMTQVVIEAVLLGIAGTVVGTILGLIGVNVLGSFLDLLGLTIERSNTIAASAIVIGAVVGIGVTIGASILPARKASVVAPIEALRNSEVEPPSSGAQRRVAAAILTLAGFATLLYGSIEGAILYAGIGIGALFLALYLGGEFLVRGIARIARPILATAGPTGTIASRNLERNAGRTAAAASALMIGVSLVSFFTLMADTIGQFIAGESADSIVAEYVVQGVGNPPGAVLSNDTILALDAVDGVETVAETFLTSVAPVEAAETSRPGPGDGVLGVAIADLANLQEVFEFELTAGGFDDVEGTAVSIDEATAESLGLELGDALAVTALSGEVELEVAAIVALTLPGQPQPSIIGDLDLADVVGYNEPATLAYVRGDTTQESLNDAVEIATIAVLETDDYVATLGSNLDTILALVFALLAVAILIALIGIANTVSLAIAERSGEIAAVRAAGANMRQIFWSLMAEFALLSLVGVLSGLAFAWVAAAGFFRALSGGQIGYPQTDVVTGVLIIVGGLIGGALATWLPARAAARADLLDVLRAE